MVVDSAPSRSDVTRQGQIERPNVKRILIGLTSAAVLAGSLGAASFGLTVGTAQAEPRFVPAYHWCPGDDFRPEWGFNWELNGCHDDHHRDGDGNDHGRDYDNGGAAFSGRGGNRGNDYRQGDNDPHYDPRPPRNYFPLPGPFGTSPNYGGW